MNQKIITLVALGFFYVGGAYAKPQIMDWSFRAPSVSNPAAIDPKTKGDITYDTSNDIFVGWNGSSWVEFGSTVTPAANVVVVTTTTEAGLGDDIVLADSSSSSFTVSLVAASSNLGKKFTIKKTNSSTANPITIDPASTETIGNASTYLLYTQDETVDIVSDGTNWVILNHKTDTDWANAGAISISATTTAPTKGTTSIDRVLWKRSGRNATIRYEYQQSSAGTAGSGSYLYTIPSSIGTVDTSVITAHNGGIIGASTDDNAITLAGYGFVGLASSNRGPAYPLLYTSSSFWVDASAVFSAQNPQSNTLYSLSNANLGFSLTLTVPISGWRE